MKIILGILDYIVAAIMGAGALCLAFLVVGEGWNMFLAMAVGMVLGMVVLLLVVFIFGPICNTLQLFPPGMITTMVIGMLAGMGIAGTWTDFKTGLAFAVGFALFVQLAIDCYDWKLKGEVPIHEPN